MNNYGNDQQAKLDSYQRVQACNTEHATGLATIPDYADLPGQFDNTVEEIIERSSEQQEITGVTAELLDNGLQK